ncbi:MAG: cysteine--tRNA ligase [Deltaproteobacteria bacterium]|nr:cysteine--tRNA ligase [Deltaproteobacteria bacterium]
MRHTILDAIGNTPLVEIKQLNPNPKVRILAKLEYLNPGGSVKDRPALAMIEDGEASGLLTRDKTVIEATSGNTGIGLAMVCAVKGFRLMLTMSEAASMERRKILMARGAQIHLTPGHLGTDGAIEEAYRLFRENPDAYFMTDQFNNPANWKSHYSGTANEIIDQTGGEITCFISTMGTTGTLMGIARRLREFDSDITIIGVEPYLGHKIQGLKNLKEAYRPEIFDKSLIDRKVNIDDEDAFEMTRRLAVQEGLFVGMSSGAAMVIAARQAEKMDKGTIVTIFPDGGERYLSTPLFSIRQKAEIRLFNTMTRAKEPFEPIRTGTVSIYSCGPTADRRLDVGQYRRYMFSDLLCRYLAYRDFKVTHVMNITDMDDKTIQGSETAGESLKDFTSRYIEIFKKDLEDLNIRPADHYPLVSEHIDDMVNLAKRLHSKGIAYEKLKSLYFNIAGFAEYGKLSGVDLDKIRLGATVDLDEYEKNNPRDFTLLKRARLSELKRGVYVQTEWGNVRPSWHIQCAAMSMKYLGEEFDIHTSSRQLVFPHHENELAIVKSLTGRPLARFWCHCETVSATGGETDLPDVEELIASGFSPKDIRYWLVSGHYRKPLGFSQDHLVQAKNARKRLNSCIQALMNLSGNAEYPEIDQLEYDIRQGFVSAMDDDLNMPHALSALFISVNRINSLMAEGRLGRNDAKKIIRAIEKIDVVMGVFDFIPARIMPEIEALNAQRDVARAAGNFKKADEIRDRLVAMGVEVKDHRAGTKL